MNRTSKLTLRVIESRLSAFVMRFFCQVLGISACLVLAIACTARDAVADTVYAVYGRRGSVTYTTRKPASGVRYRILRRPSPIYSGIRRSRWSPRAISSTYDDLILDTAVDHSVEPALVKAVVHVESAFNPRARSHKGAMGLMQLMPATARRFGVSNAYAPEQNVDGGVRYLRWLLRRYGGNHRLALAAYNAGEKAVDRYRAIPPYRETQQYVRRVLRAREIYRCDYRGKKRCSS